MAIWLFRAGRIGEYENKFLNDGRIYLTWDSLSEDLLKFHSKKELFDFLVNFYANAKANAIRNWTAQVWPIAHSMQKGDWVILPSKRSASIHVGKVTGDYEFNPAAQNTFYHSRTVEWFATEIPRSNFDQDILYSFGAFMTVCKIARNDAENRIKQMAKNNWRSDHKLKEKPEFIEEPDVESGISDLEQLATDQIAKFLIQRFSGHKMAYLIDEILKAKGYVTYRSPEGPDKGIDILAAPEPMGFGKPRLCVQVKSGDSPVDRMTLDQLIGAMQNFNADQGLLVSWGGFKSTVNKEIPSQFFRVRLWSQAEIISEILDNYEKLDDSIKSELPLKRIWALSLQVDEE